MTTPRCTPNFLSATAPAGATNAATLSDLP
jgi:hypothetical protein